MIYFVPTCRLKPLVFSLACLLEFLIASKQEARKHVPPGLARGVLYRGLFNYGKVSCVITVRLDKTTSQQT